MVRLFSLLPEPPPSRFAPRTGWTCPDCATAVVVRGTVFGDDFWPNLGAVAAPVVVLGLICTVLYRVGARGGGR